MTKGQIAQFVNVVASLCSIGVTSSVFVGLLAVEDVGLKKYPKIF